MEWLVRQNESMPLTRARHVAAADDPSTAIWSALEGLYRRFRLRPEDPSAVTGWPRRSRYCMAGTGWPVLSRFTSGHGSIRSLIAFLLMGCLAPDHAIARSGLETRWNGVEEARLTRSAVTSSRPGHWLLAYLSRSSVHEDS